MDDLLTCRVCYEQYKEGIRAPVLLPRCGHTFCRPCVAYLQSGCSVTCRVCSTEQRVDSAEALPTEFSLLAIIAARDCQKAETCKIHEVKLSFWCRTCSEATCGECLFEDHPTHSHDVVRAQKYIQEMRIIARDIGDKFMDALDSREQRFYNRVFKGARAISNALRSVNVLRKDMDEARTLMKGAREVENIVPAKELAEAAKYLGLKWSIQDVNLYTSKEKQEENRNKKDTEEKVLEEVKEDNKDCENNEVKENGDDNKNKENEDENKNKENEDENKNKEDIAEKENEIKENGDPENKENKSENNVENKECKEKSKEEKNKVKKKAQRRYSDSEDSDEETNRLKTAREEKAAKEAAILKRVAEKEAEEKLRENIMKQLKEERIKKEEEQRKKEEEEKKATLKERQLGRQARLRLKKSKTMGIVLEQCEQLPGESGKLDTSASIANVPTIKTTDDIPTDEQKKENEASVKKKKQEKNESEEKEKENERTKENNSNDIKDKNNENGETSNNEDQNREDGAKADSEHTGTKEKRNKEKQDDEDKDLDESAENPMTEYEPDDKPGGNKIKIDICQFPAFQIVVEGHGGRLARMEWEDKGLHIYCHQFQELPYDVIIKSAVLYSMIPTKSPLVFIDINGGKHSLGRVYIRLWGHLRRAQNFLTLCLGDLGSCYMCTRFLETFNDEVPGERIKGGDYEFNNGHGGKGVIQDLESGKEYCLPMESGMISSGGGHGEQSESQFMICTEGNPDSNFSCPFGIVVSGLPTIKQAVHRMTVQDVWIRDCGIVIETTNFQA